MKRLLLAVALVTLPVASVSAQQTITFDDLSTSCFGGPPPYFCQIQDGYAGLNWSNFDVLSTTTRNQPSGYLNGTITPPNVAFNGGASDASILSIVNPFTLNSGYFTAAWNDGLQLALTGYVGSTPTYFVSYLLNTQTPQLLTFDWVNLSRVSFVSSGGVNHGYNGQGSVFVLDNLTVNQTSAVPEPASLALLATGLLGLAPMMRRKLRK